MVPPIWSFDWAISVWRAATCCRWSASSLSFAEIVSSFFCWTDARSPSLVCRALSWVSATVWYWPLRAAISVFSRAIVACRSVRSTDCLSSCARRSCSAATSDGAAGFLAMSRRTALPLAEHGLRVVGRVDADVRHLDPQELLQFLDLLEVLRVRGVAHGEVGLVLLRGHLEFAVVREEEVRDDAQDHAQHHEEDETEMDGGRLVLGGHDGL